MDVPILFLLRKISQQIFYPLSLSLCGIVIAYFILQARSNAASIESFKKTQRSVQGLLFTCFLLLFVSSLPLTSFLLMRSLESEWAHPIDLQGIQSANAVIVLGGTTTEAIPGEFPPEELRGNRLYTTYLLYATHKVRKVIVSDGTSYRLPNGEFRKRCEDMRDILVRYGVPAADILLESDALTTDGNAKGVARLLNGGGTGSYILVTSAYHMKRAVMLFEKEGLEVRPVPSSFETAVLPTFWYLPSADSLSQTTRAIKEYVAVGISKAF